MKIAVTGCSGSVGRRVVKLALDRGHAVVGVDLVDASPQPSWLSHPEYIFKSADLQDFEAAKEVIAGCDAVINLAAYPTPVDYKVKAHNTNVVISWNILRACAELGINSIAQASSVNVITLNYSKKFRFHYFPLDEDHPCEPDEPYGLSKLICEIQADTIVRRYPTMRVASLRLHWSVPSREVARGHMDSRGLWSYVQEDSAADAFLLSLEDNGKWSGHERFFITAPITVLEEETLTLTQQYWPDVPIKEGKTLSGTQGLFDCSKAGALLGWYHRDV